MSPGIPLGCPWRIEAVRRDPNPPGFASEFGGVIDEVEIFNRALSAVEIKTIYDADDEGKIKILSTVTGQVLWNELPIPGSEVQIKERGNFHSLPVLRSAITDAAGRFKILNAPIGEYTIYATSVIKHR